MSSQAAPLKCFHYVRELTLEAGGVVRAVLDLCGSLAKRGHDVTLVTPRADDVPDAWRNQEDGQPKLISVADAARPGRRLSRDGLEEIASLLARADLLHLHTPWEPSNLQIAKLAQKIGMPYVVTPHGMLDDWSMAQKSLKKRVFLRLGGARFLTAAAALHFTAEAERDQGMRWVPDAWGRERVIPLIFDMGDYRELMPPAAALTQLDVPAADRPRILFLSRLHVKKGLELLIDAVAELRARDCHVQLLLAGPGEEDYQQALVSRVAAHGIDDRVEFLGMVRGERKLALYRAADIFVLPTYQENFGIVLVEALASATPVITTRGTDIWQELQSAGAQIVEHQVEAIATAMETWLRNRDQLPDVGQRGRDYVLNWLSEDRVAAEYERLYADLVAR